jgi:magnesium-transporting ATPase (P-type)
LLATVPFSSARKRMSVVVRDNKSGQHWLYTKGADNVIFDRTQAGNGFDAFVGGRAAIDAQLEVIKREKEEERLAG